MEFVTKLFVLFLCCILRDSDASCDFRWNQSQLDDAFNDSIGNSRCSNCNVIKTSSKFEAHCRSFTGSLNCPNSFYLAVHHVRNNEHSCELVCDCKKLFKILNQELVSGSSTYKTCSEEILKIKKRFSLNILNRDSSGILGEFSESNNATSIVVNTTNCPIAFGTGSSNLEMTILRTVSCILAALLFLQTVYFLKIKALLPCNKPPKRTENTIELTEQQNTSERAVEINYPPEIPQVNGYGNDNGEATYLALITPPYENIRFERDVVYSDGVENLSNDVFARQLDDSFNIYHIYEEISDNNVASEPTDEN